MGVFSFSFPASDFGDGTSGAPVTTSTSASLPTGSGSVASANLSFNADVIDGSGLDTIAEINVYLNDHYIGQFASDSGTFDSYGPYGVYAGAYSDSETFSVPLAEIDQNGSNTLTLVDADPNSEYDVSSGTLNLTMADTTPPTVTIADQDTLTDEAAQIVSGAIIAGQAEVGTTVVLYDNGTQIGTGAVGNGGAWSASITLSNGTNDIVADDTDAANNTGSSNTVVYTLYTGPFLKTNAGTAVDFDQGQASPLTIDGAISLTDTAGDDISSATVTISSGFQSGDTLAFDNGSTIETFPDGATITASQSGDTLALSTSSGDATASDYQSALESVTYNFTGDPTVGGTDPTRTVTWSVTDTGGLTSNNGSTSAIDVFGLPVISGTGNTNEYYQAENGSPVLIDFYDVALLDPNGADITGATVTISSGFQSADTLNILVAQAGITESYSNGVLTLSGDASVDTYWGALQLVTYSFSGDPSNGGTDPTRAVTWSVTDADGLTSAAVSPTTLDVYMTPVLSGQPTSTPTIKTGAVAADSNLIITDGNAFGATPVATVKIGSGAQSGDTLSFDGEAPETFADKGVITPTFDAATKTLTLTGSRGAGLADFQAALEAVQFNAGPPNGTRSLTWSLNDHAGGSNVSNDFISSVDVEFRPTLMTSQQPATAIVGASIADQATVSGGYNPTGMVSFSLYDNPTGAGTPLFADANEPLSNGIATSASYTAAATGTDYWVATYNGDANNNSVTSGDAAEPVTVTPASPSISSSQQPTTAVVGTAIADRATVSGGYNPTGTVTFNLYNNPNGTGTPLFTDPNEPLSNGVATSKAYSTAATGTDYWVATYSGDTTNNTVSSTTGAEPVSITPTSPILTTTASPPVTLSTAPVALTDSAILAGGFEPTGTITFALTDPSGAIVDTEMAKATGNGTYTTPTGYTLPDSGPVAGTYSWLASYSGDSNNNAVSDSDVTDEQTTVFSPPTISGAPVDPVFTTSETPVEPFSGVTIGDVNNNGTDANTLSITFSGDGTLVDGAGFIGTKTLSDANGSYTLSGTAAAITSELDALSFTPVNGAPGTSVTTTFTLSDLSSAFAAATVNSATRVIDTDPAPSPSPVINFPHAATSNVDEWILANGQWTASAEPGSIPSGYQVAGTGDFTGNGTGDILWFNGTTGDTQEWLINNGAWNGTVDLGTHPGNYQISGVGDFTGNGIDDVLWTSNSGGAVQTDIWELGSNGQWSASVSPGSHPAGYQVAGVGDFTGNGTDDILWYDPSNGNVDEWQIANGQWAASVDLGSHPGSGWTIAGVGDFTGNGIDDVLWTNSSGGTVQTDIWELGSNGQWINSVSPGSHPAGYQVAAIGKFAGNGTDDILWQNPSTGDVDEWLISNGQWTGSIDLGTHPGNFQIAGTGAFVNGNSTSDIFWHAAS